MSPLLHLIFRDGAVVFVTMICVFYLFVSKVANIDFIYVTQTAMALGSSMHESFRNTWNRPVYSYVSSFFTDGPTSLNNDY